MLVNHSGVLHPVGHHVVNVFDEDEVGTLFVEVFDECTVSAGAKDEVPVFVTERVVLLIDSDNICIMLLFRESYFQFMPKVLS